MTQHTPAKNMTEKELLANVRELAKLTGWLCYHTHNSQRSEPGFPDLVLLQFGLNPRLCFIELKSQKGQLTRNQMVWGVQLAQLNKPVSYHVFRPADWLDGTIERILKGE